MLEFVGGGAEVIRNDLSLVFKIHFPSDTCKFTTVEHTVETDKTKLSFITCPFNSCKVNVKLSLCLTKHRSMKMYRGSGSIAPCILDLGTR
jgi:hypothetical protein